MLHQRLCHASQNMLGQAEIAWIGGDNTKVKYVADTYSQLKMMDM